MRIFRVLLFITILTHFSVALALVYPLRHVHSPVGAAIVMATLLLSLSIVRLRRALSDTRKPGWETRLLDIPFYIHWCAALLLLPLTLVTLIVALGRSAVSGALFPYSWFFAEYMVGLALAAYGILIRRRWFVIERHDVVIPNLHSAFDGWTIAQLSDLHIGSLAPLAWGLRWARAANALSPDLVVVTGDMVTSGTVFHDDIAQVVGALRAKHGTFVCMGNHDYFGDGEPLLTKLTEAGARVLRNDGVVLEHEGGKLYLAGVDDTWTRRTNFESAMRNHPEGVPTIMLAHDPGLFPEAVSHGVELTLSGHTHAGQVAVPFFANRWSLAHLAHKYSVGFYHEAASVLYVNPGLGTTGPPVRLGAAPAITLITLRRKN